MAFSTKIKLANTNVEQSSNESLILSGHTQINTGTAILNYTTHPNFTGDTQVVDKKYVDLKASGASGTTIYNLASPASVTVGGIVAGTPLTGKTSNQILSEILVPTLQPVVTEPSGSMSMSISGNKEVGSSQTFQICSIFSKGTVSPAYCGGPAVRSGNAISYCFVGACVAGNHTCTGLIDTETATGYVVTAGSNSWSSCVYYGSGSTVNDSTGAAGTVVPNPLGAGNTVAANASITGIYPYYWGEVNAHGAPGAGRPASTAALITGGTKVVADGGGTINIIFNSGDSDYIWFAVPAAIATKTAWYVNALNNGAIGGAVSAGGNLFPAPDTVNNVANGLWSGQSYKLYISNYQTAAASSMALS